MHRKIGPTVAQPFAHQSRGPLSASRPVERRKVLWSFLASALLAPSRPVHAQASHSIPKLVISPPGDGLRDLFEHANEWAQARSLTGMIVYADHSTLNFSEGDLRTWLATMRTWNIGLEFEVGALKGWGPTADIAFQMGKPIWDRAMRLGANLVSIVLDEPLAGARALQKSDTYAVEQTARFIGLVRQHFPGVRIGDVEPYPGINLEDHMAWLARLQARLQALHIAPLDFYRADVDWVSFAKAGKGSWKGVAALADGTHKAGLPFSLIYWASGYPSENTEGFTGPDTWYVEVMAQGYAVVDAGIHPDQFVLESWIHTPPRTVPEDQDYTFTRSVLDFGRKFVR